MALHASVLVLTTLNELLQGTELLISSEDGTLQLQDKEKKNFWYGYCFILFFECVNIGARDDLVLLNGTSLTKDGVVVLS
ncbi:hypothetical protein GUJ93_ZPchr0005g14273 [Zizania palustris]|uniref:Uncharacterized protein n=1 Tax=Zizania palustris TaxID=103762 RepID=A0A8J5T8X9_ZIZPA|nr:hypothetical protein GUJ93_ZPchr0005g14273 [Zizania palustris]